MNLKKIVQRKILQDYVFITGTIDIDSEYFIKKIEEQIRGENNLNGVTNVVGGMTDWCFFANDEKFWIPTFPIIDYIDQNKLFEENFSIKEVWGVSEAKGHYTKRHKHFPSIFSGVIYLNSCDQTLFFPDIKEEIKPEPGAFAIFSGFLNHYNHRNTSDVTKYALSFNAKELKTF